MTTTVGVISKPLDRLVRITYAKAARTKARSMPKRFQQKPNSPLQVQSNESFASHLYVLFSHASKVAEIFLHYRLRRQMKQCNQKRARVDDCYANQKEQRFSAQWLQKDLLAEIGQKETLPGFSDHFQLSGTGLILVKFCSNCNTPDVCFHRLHGLTRDKIELCFDLKVKVYKLAFDGSSRCRTKVGNSLVAPMKWNFFKVDRDVIEVCKCLENKVSQIRIGFPHGTTYGIPVKFHNLQSLHALFKGATCSVLFGSSTVLFYCENWLTKIDHLVIKCFRCILNMPRPTYFSLILLCSSLCVPEKIRLDGRRWQFGQVFVNHT